MKRLRFFLNSFLIATLLTIASCGNSDALNSSRGSNSNSLTGNTCGCPATYSPVNDGYNRTFDNSCIASCHGVSRSYPGNLVCRNDLQVCARNAEGGQGSLSECSARAFRYMITSYAPCGRAGL